MESCVLVGCVCGVCTDCGCCCIVCSRPLWNMTSWSFRSVKACGVCTRDHLTEVCVCMMCVCIICVYDASLCVLRVCMMCVCVDVVCSACAKRTCVCMRDVTGLILSMSCPWMATNQWLMHSERARKQQPTRLVRQYHRYVVWVMTRPSVPSIHDVGDGTSFAEWDLEILTLLKTYI